MLRDDKVGICFGRLAPMDEFGTFDGKKFNLDEARLGAECDAAADAGANIERFMAQAVWGPHPYGRRSQFQPFVYDLKTKRWELEKRNDYYFPIMKRIVARNQASNKTTIISVFDGCELRGIASTFSPWVVNNQGVRTFYDPKADEYTGDFFRDCVSELKAYDIIWDFNEPENAAYPAFFERVILPIVKEKKIPWTRLTYGATTKSEKPNSVQDQVRTIVRDAYGRAAERTIIRPDHSFPFTESLKALEPYNTDLYSDDGCYLPPGLTASICDVRPGKGARPSARTWGKVSLAILKLHPIMAGVRGPLVYFEHLPAGFSIGDLLCWLAPIMAISASYRARFGCWPSNYGKHR